MIMSKNETCKVAHRIVLLDLSPIGHDWFRESVISLNVLDKQFPVLKVARYSYSKRFLRLTVLLYDLLVSGLLKYCKAVK